MNYASACDGIGAVHVAWPDWECAWTAEIEPFPAAVLEHHFGYPNLGDITEITDAQLEQHGPIGLLVGGTPCQDFSVAGLRAGMAAPRGNLALAFLGLAARARPEWVVWENVPGVLSSNEGRDFGTFLGALGELGYGFAYRVLDAQHFGVPQRRRRVFVVGYLGDWRRAAAVLFERESLSGNPAPGREAGEGAAAPLTPGSPKGSGYRNDADTTENLVAGGQVAVAFDARQSDVIQYGEKTGPLDTDGHTMAVCFDETQITHGENRSNPQPGDPSHPLAAGARPPSIATPASVRRLTPRECERLQGFPDDYTAIPYRNKPAADGPRYKALGNSMAVPVVAWIGRRVLESSSIEAPKEARL